MSRRRQVLVHLHRLAALHTSLGLGHVRGNFLSLDRLVGKMLKLARVHHKDPVQGLALAVLLLVLIKTYRVVLAAFESVIGHQLLKLLTDDHHGSVQFCFHLDLVLKACILCCFVEVLSLRILVTHENFAVEVLR